MSRFWAARSTSWSKAAAPVALIFCFDALLFFLVVPLAMAFVQASAASIGRAVLGVVRGVVLNPLLIAAGLGAVGGYKELRDYTDLGGQLTVFTLAN